MSYRGRPSKGCEGCRARKLKQGRHECRYRDQADLLFRNQTAAAAQRAEDSWRKRSKSHQRATSESVARQTFTSSRTIVTNVHQGSSSSPENPEIEAAVACGAGTASDPTTQVSLYGFGGLSIAPMLAPDIRLLAYQRFIYDFVVPESPNTSPEEPSDAIMNFVPLLYQHTDPGSCFAMIANAVCYINFFNRCNSTHALKLAQNAYGKALKLLSKMIADKEQAASNDALASVYLMGVYENLSSMKREGTFVAHEHGATVLLQLRSLEEYLSNRISGILYELIFWQQLLGNLQAAKHAPIPVENVINVSRHLENAYIKLNALIVRLIWREAQLHARWQDVKASEAPPTSRWDLHRLLQAALDLHADFQAWEDNIPELWRYKAELNTAQARSTFDPKWQKLVLSSIGAPKEIHYYSNLKRIWIWSFYRTTRIFLYRDTLEMLNWMLRFPEAEHPMCDVRVDSAQNSGTSDSGIASTPISSLDNVTLLKLHHTSTNQLVDVIEQACSSILSSFIVPIHSKSCDDISVIRGYVALWPLEILDSVLSSGLVLHIAEPNTKLEANLTSSMTGLNMQTASATSSGLKQPVYYASSSKIAASAPVQATSISFTSYNQCPAPMPTPANTSVPTPIYDPTAKWNHIFDSQPRHPYDHPIDLQAFDTHIAKPKGIDVPARREWLNRILYYLGTELGIQKALAMPFMKGYYQIVKPQVERILA
ncbi:hypothetical protein EK21DRAFT_96835 [Setomelanomma holmii]|uniref:Uncharacterized protein n=1 Tax=Setomelanomma holmii TaxID=210430 RepID=A0A9P4HLB6_9PLEO|nr:hypothetical protein EK21DRAFT_96835 [Setomelanomma holmii]